MRIIFAGKVANGRLKLDDQEAFNQWLVSLGECEVQLSIGKRKKIRSHNENRYYWGVVIRILSAELGYSDDEMHEALKWKFLRIKENSIPTVKSTANLSTTEFEDYAAQIRRWAAQELNIQVPEPNEVEY